MSNRYKKRYFKVAVAVYNAMRQVADNHRNLPIVGEVATTETALPVAEDQPVANDGSGMLVVALAHNDVKPADEVEMAPHIAAGYIVELTKAEYESLLPEEEI
ncbi:hypothetical protein ACFPK9_01285 [Rubritalea spongiae]|uniref:Uncharacterized protein n=1 Tax=Rubritalea spongiae TaxID=430797 RepID=A0ABW5E0D8_9BACT